MSIILAILIGAAFGFVLDRVGATNPNVLGRMLALRDLRLAKAILLGIGVFSILMFGGVMAGVVDVGHLSVKAAHLGVLVGGLLLGLGWAAAGYCPGTGVCAMAAGRHDAFAYVLGGLVGAFIYTLMHGAIDASGLLADIGGGKVSLGQVPGASFGAVWPGLRGDVVGIVMGAIFVAVAFLLPERLLPAKAGAEPVPNAA